MNTYLHETPRGEKIEYRLDESRSNRFATFIECRVLRNSGHPFDERWYPVAHADWCSLQVDSDIIAMICDEHRAQLVG